MARGRKAIHQTDEERNNAINESKMKYYKKNRVELLKKQSEKYHSNKATDEVVQPTQPIKKVTVWGNHDIEEITYEAFDDDSSGDYEGNII